jgi:hypothetical protein
VAGLLVLTGALTGTIGPAAATGSTASDRALASQIKCGAPTSHLAVSGRAREHAQPPGWVATSRKAIACIQHVTRRRPGVAMGPDPFRLGARPVGDVTADVSSPMFAVGGPSQLLSASSEVVMTTTAMQATADLRPPERYLSLDPPPCEP